jgi:REP element-mobilizing transposase RayT
MGRQAQRVIAYHIAMSFYGFWLPNDPRGSGSRRVWSEALKPFGPATHVASNVSVAERPHDHRLRQLAKSALKHEPILLDGRQARSVATGFKQFLTVHRIECYACAILPDHVHLVIGQTTRSIDRCLTGLKAAAVHQLNIDGLHPCSQALNESGGISKLFARGGRHVFLFDETSVASRVQYVNDNPVEAGLPKQTWHFVVPFA